MPRIIHTFDIGDTVVCDWCNKDWTGRPETGGFLFGGKATGPCCAVSILDGAKRHNELDMIRDRCPPEMSFAEWVLQLRGGDNTITVTTFDPGENPFKKD